ncbi:MAG: hypothetical protein ACPG06_06155 [Alphaproteobacteria bacterium]
MLQALRTNDGKRLALLWLTLALFAQWFATPAHALSQQDLDRAAIGADPIAAAILSLCLPSQPDEEGNERPTAQGGNACQACHASGTCLSAACAMVCTTSSASLLLHNSQQNERAIALYLQHKAARAPPVIL